MVLCSAKGNLLPSSSDEEPNERPTKSATGERAGCSYIEQYSHVPETSAFQRRAQAPPPPPQVTPRAFSIDKEHNSEQYGRDFTTYDGITARTRRHSASVPTRDRNDTPKQAADRMHKIRHKLNPVRDYRLMDTVHYLAQGEFAPRDDGIKLTPSREAVLSDIIWEDVCRTHWPNTRLNRRIAAHPERNYSTRRGSGELSRQIDSLLRERVTHVERRRRRHYRIVKLNNRQENSKSMGKTGDIIVASHKRKDRDLAASDHRTSPVLSERQWPPRQCNNKSHDRLVSHKHRRSNRSDECAPGPSYAIHRVTETRQESNFYRPPRLERPDRGAYSSLKTSSSAREASSGSNASYSCNNNSCKSMRHGINKDVSRRKHQRETPNLENFILLPTLVVRTPSNVRRQKKFNELYHRILNMQYQNNYDVVTSDVDSEAAGRSQGKPCQQRDISLNVNIALSDSKENNTS